MSEAPPLPPSLRALVGVRSERVHALIAYLGGLETTLAVSPLLASIGRRLDDASRPLRIPLRVQPYQPVRALDELRAHENFRRGGGDTAPGRRAYAALDEAAASQDTPVQPQSLDPLAASLERAVLLGDPGSGKTEWLKHQAYDAAHTFRTRLEAGTARPEDLPFPVFLPLPTVARALADETRLHAFLAASGCIASPALVLDPARRVAAALLQALVTQQALPEVLLPWVWARLTSPRLPATPPALLLCLDAWDEVRGDRHELATSVRAYAETGSARLFITSRIVGYGDATERPLPPPPADATSGAEPAWRRELLLLPYTGAETETFVDRFFAEAPTRAGGLLRHAMRRELQEKPAVAGMAQNPLLATLLCLAFAADPERAPLPFPLRRGPVYERVLHGLLGTWRRTKRRTPQEPRLNRELIEAKLRLLEAIAVAFFPAEELSAAELDTFFWDEAHGYMRRLDPADALRQRLQRGQGTSPLAELCDDGVLVRSGPGDEAGYLFLHLTFQEYLVARARARQAKTHGWAAIAGFVDRAAWLPAVWQEVLVLLAGQLADPRPLLALLADDARDDDLRHRLAVAAECLAELPPARADVRPLASRITTETFALWWDHATAQILYVVPHLTHALPALAVWNGAVSPTRRVLPTALHEPRLHTFGSPGAPVAIDNTGSGRDPDTAPTLLKLVGGLLRNPNGKVRQTAMNAVEALGPAAAKRDILAALAALLGDRSYNWAATDAIRALGPAAATAAFLADLTSLLVGTDDDVRQKAMDVVKTLGPAAAERDILAALVAPLCDRCINESLAAAGAVRALGPAAAAAVLAPLASRLGSADDDVRQAAMERVKALGSVAAERDILAALAALLGGPDDDVGRDACYAVYALGDAAAKPEFLASLGELLRATDRGVRWRAASCVVTSLGPATAGSIITTALPTLLRDPDDGVRCLAAEAVGKLRSVDTRYNILAALVALLRDPNSWVRFAAEEALDALGSEAATPAVLATLAELLRDTDVDVRRVAAIAVGRLGPAAAADRDVLASLSAVLADPDQFVLREAKTAAERILGPADATPTFLAALATLLRNPSWRVRESAEAAMSMLGPAAATPAFLTALNSLLRDLDDGVRQTALGVVRALGPSVVDSDIPAALSTLLRDPIREVRHAAARTISDLGMSADGEYLAALAEAIQGSDRGRDAAVELVIELERAAATPVVLAALATLLSSSDWTARDIAIRAVSRLGSAAADPNFLAALLAIVRNIDGYGSQAAVAAVYHIGPAAATPAFLVELDALLRDPDQGVRSAAVRAVCAIGTAEAADMLTAASTDRGILAMLAALVHDPDRNIRRRAIATVGAMRTAVDDGILAALAAQLRDPDAGTREEVVGALRRLGAVATTSAFLAMLAALLRDPSLGVRMTALDAVRALGSATASAAFLAALAVMLQQDEHWEVRSMSVAAVHILGPATATPAFIAALGTILRRPGDIRDAAAAAGAIGPAAADRVILTALARQLRHPEYGCNREAALRVLGELRGSGLRVFSHDGRIARIQWASDLASESELSEPRDWT